MWSSFAVPLAFLFLSETPAPAAFLGGLLILFSGFLVMRSAEKERKDKNRNWARSRNH